MDLTGVWSFRDAPNLDWTKTVLFDNNGLRFDPAVDGFLGDEEDADEDADGEPDPG